MKPNILRVYFALACTLSLSSLQTACSQQGFFGSASQVEKAQKQNKSKSPIPFDRLSHEEQIEIVDARLDRDIADIAEATLNAIESSKEPIELNGVELEVTADDLRRLIDSVPGGDLSSLTLRDVTGVTADDVLDLRAMPEDYAEFAEATNLLVRERLSALGTTEFELTGLKLQAASSWCKSAEKLSNWSGATAGFAQEIAVDSGSVAASGAAVAAASCTAAAAEVGVNPFADAACGAGTFAMSAGKVGGAAAAALGIVSLGEKYASKAANAIGHCSDQPQAPAQRMPKATLRLSSQK